MSSYESGIKKINKIYDDIITEIEDLKSKYDDVINKLGEISGLEECNNLKTKIINKKDTLDNKISDIKDIKTTLLKRAKEEDKKEEEANA